MLCEVWLGEHATRDYLQKRVGHWVQYAHDPSHLNAHEAYWAMDEAISFARGIPHFDGCQAYHRILYLVQVVICSLRRSQVYNGTSLV